MKAVYRIKNSIPRLDGALVEIVEELDEGLVDVRLLEDRKPYRKGDRIEMYRYELELEVKHGND
jgi:hypothetical protein